MGQCRDDRRIEPAGEQHRDAGGSQRLWQFAGRVRGSGGRERADSLRDGSCQLLQQLVNDRLEVGIGILTQLEVRPSVLQKRTRWLGMLLLEWLLRRRATRVETRTRVAVIAMFIDSLLSWMPLAATCAESLNSFSDHCKNGARVASACCDWDIAAEVGAPRGTQPRHAGRRSCG